MKRPKSTKTVIEGATGGVVAIVRPIYEGLIDTPVREFYPVLNLDDVLAFELGVTELRNQHPVFFKDFVDHATIYELFREVYNASDGVFPNYSGAFPKLVKYNKFIGRCRGQRPSESDSKTYGKLNPFGKTRNLKERLSLVSEGDVGTLRERLVVEPSLFLFETDFHRDPRSHHDSGKRVRVLPRPFPAAGYDTRRIVQAYVSSISTVLRSYDPTHVNPSTIPAPVKKEDPVPPKAEGPVQLKLF
ncbi:hypothetical protein HN587_04520 [Candidatus Woesearchaeota archaeon]|jgi:hypothetical protein|nr:hypothetical protein [Candidatus Woesearchaeota archaeon]